MSTEDTDDFKQWRERAEKLRLIAESLNDPHSRASLLAIAEDYEKLAARAEARSKRGKRRLINRLPQSASLLPTPPRSSSGSLAMLAAIRRASSRVSSFAADRRPGSSSK
jgi:hypothetical protein